MSHEDAALQAATDPAPSGVCHLTRQDVDRLTNYKWRYSLEAHGFSTQQATRLLFMKWLYARGAVGS